MKKQTCVFLTGDIGIGKTTAIRKFIARMNLSYDGIVTRFDTRRGERKLSIYRADSEMREDEWESIVAAEISVSSRTIHYEAFENFGTAALNSAGRRDIVLIDEIGIMEENCEAFTAAVMKLLEGDKPVLGVLKKAASPFLEKVKQHKNVIIITVTEDNRNEIPDIIKNALDNNT